MDPNPKSLPDITYLCMQTSSMSWNAMQPSIALVWCLRFSWRSMAGTLLLLLRLIMDRTPLWKARDLEMLNKAATTTGSKPSQDLIQIASDPAALFEWSIAMWAKACWHNWRSEAPFTDGFGRCGFAPSSPTKDQAMIWAGKERKVHGWCVC